MTFDTVSESPEVYAGEVDYEHAHHDAEHEHEIAREPEPSDATEPRSRAF